VISGVGFGSGFQDGIRTVIPLALAHERSGVLSLLYVVSYVGEGRASPGGFLSVPDMRAGGFMKVSTSSTVGVSAYRSARHSISASE
jgi:hypothetical protein